MADASPHDRFFKAIFSRLDVLADTVRRVLDPALVAAIDWDRIELLPTEYIGGDLVAGRSDLLLKAHFAGQEGFICVLAEHPSSYTYGVSELEPGLIERRLVPRLAPASKEAMMTTAERLRREGEERGIAKGRERGRLEGHALLVRQLLHFKFRNLPPTSTPASPPLTPRRSPAGACASSTRPPSTTSFGAEPSHPISP